MAPIRLSPQEFQIAAKRITETAESFEATRKKINQYIEEMVQKNFVSADAMVYVNQIKSFNPRIIKMYNTMISYVDYCTSSGNATIRTTESNISNIKTNINNLNKAKKSHIKLFFSKFVVFPTFD